MVKTENTTGTVMYRYKEFLEYQYNTYQYKPFNKYVTFGKKLKQIFQMNPQIFFFLPREG